MQAVSNLRGSMMYRWRPGTTWEPAAPRPAQAFNPPMVYSQLGAERMGQLQKTVFSYPWVSFGLNTLSVVTAAFAISETENDWVKAFGWTVVILGSLRALSDIGVV